MAELVFGHLPPDAVVMHLCDNRLCLNPKHLRVGTQADNVRDMFAKGRDGRTVSPSRFARGSRVGTARLTEAQVMDIKARLRGGQSQRSVAREFGVHRSTIRFIAKGIWWKHVA